MQAWQIILNIARNSLLPDQEQESSSYIVFREKPGNIIYVPAIAITKYLIYHLYEPGAHRNLYRDL